MKLFSKSFALFFIVALTACASIGLQPAQSFGDKLAYAYGVHTAVLLTATTSVTNKKLSITEAIQIKNLANQSRTLLDAAKVIKDSGGDLSTATAKLTLATTILTQLQAYLKGQSNGT